MGSKKCIQVTLLYVILNVFRLDCSPLQLKLRLRLNSNSVTDFSEERQIELSPLMDSTFSTNPIFQQKLRQYVTENPGLVKYAQSQLESLRDLNLKSLKGVSEDEELCLSDIIPRPLRKLNNTNHELRYIVNLGNSPQYIREVVCREGGDSNCKYHTNQAGHIGSCQQIDREINLLTASFSNSTVDIKFDKFKIKWNCECILKETAYDLS